MRSQFSNRGPIDEDLLAPGFQALLTDLQRDCAFFRRFSDWTDVLAFMWAGSTRGSEKDKVMEPLLKGYRDNPDSQIGQILLTIFRPGLFSLLNRKRYWDQDQEELWQNTALAFFLSLSRVDLAVRRTRLVQKVYNDTISRLHKVYMKVWAEADHQKFAPLGDDHATSCSVDPMDYLLVDHHDEIATKVALVQRAIENGSITSIDAHILIETRIYGQQLVDCAKGVGLDPAVAFKRRERAEQRVPRFSVL